MMCALNPISGHPLAVDLDYAEEARGNWPRALDQFHQLCCLFKKSFACKLEFEIVSL